MLDSAPYSHNTTIDSIFRSSLSQSPVNVETFHSISGTTEYHTSNEDCDNPASTYASKEVWVVSTKVLPKLLQSMFVLTR